MNKRNVKITKKETGRRHACVAIKTITTPCHKA